MRKKQNFLLKKVTDLAAKLPKGARVLDLGCGDGLTGKGLLELGYRVDACDMDEGRFQFHGVIPFSKADILRPLPYGNGVFDAVILMEVIEHIYTPEVLIADIARVLKPGGSLILSTPNILNVRSRLRFLFEGAYDFFREPTLDYAREFPAGIQNMHVIPWRYQDLEYLLWRQGFESCRPYADVRQWNLFPALALLWPLLILQVTVKEFISRGKGGVSYTRMNRLLLSADMLLGKHLVVETGKAADLRKSF